jgi:very-short-patch-repair endonuclease
MEHLPDPDWYLDNVLAYAEPGGATAVSGPADEWQRWWRRQYLDAGDSLPARSAREQGFVLTTAQARDVGWTENDLRREIRRRRWSAPARGIASPVVVPREDTSRVAQRRRAALAATAAALLRPDQVIGGRSAAVLHGLPTFSIPDRPELTARRDVTMGRRTRAHIHSAKLPTDDIATWFGAPVIAVARTLADLGRHDRGAAIMAADAALRENLTTVQEIDRVLADAAGWPYIRRARHVLARASPLAESPLESLVRLALHDAGFPDPELQVEIGGFRVDFLWRTPRLILEADGRGKYTGDELWREKRRERELRRLGYRVERVTWEDVVANWSATRAHLARELRFLPGVGS